MKIHFFQHLFLAKEASSNAETAYNFPVFFLGLGPVFFNGSSPLVTPFQSIALLFCDTTDLAVKSTSVSLSMILCPYIRHHNEFTSKNIKGIWQKRVSLLCICLRKENNFLSSWRWNELLVAQATKVVILLHTGISRMSFKLIWRSGNASRNDAVLLWQKLLSYQDHEFRCLYLIWSYRAGFFVCVIEQDRMGCFFFSWGCKKVSYRN